MNRTTVSQNCFRRGFTLIELIVVVSITAILLAMAIPAIIQQRQQAEEASAVQLAKSLNMAKSSYLFRVGKGAAVAAYDATDNEGRYDLVKSYLSGVSGQSADLSGYMLPGYSVTMNTISNRVQLFRGGTEIVYK